MVRLAVEQDIPRLVELGESFYNATRLADYINYDPVSTGEFLHSLIAGAVSVVFVSERNGLVVGSIAGCVVPCYWNKTQSIAQQLFFYLEPAHRGSAALGLIRAWEVWAVTLGASTILSGSKSENNELGMTRRFLTRLGYAPLEETCIKGAMSCQLP